MYELYLVVHDTYILILIAFIAFDILTGTLQAFKNHTVYSKINKEGITTHITILTFCMFFSWVFNIFETGDLSKVIILFYIGSYALSIFENLGKMGIPLPKWLAKRFTLLQKETNEGEGVSNEIKRP